jgi:hypothetical protein
MKERVNSRNATHLGYLAKYTTIASRHGVLSCTAADASIRSSATAVRSVAIRFAGKTIESS